jgi:hypothetical protein
MAILRSIEDTSPRQFQILKDLDRDQTGAYGIICDADREVIYIVNHSAALDLATR